MAPIIQTLFFMCIAVAGALAAPTMQIADEPKDIRSDTSDYVITHIALSTARLSSGEIVAPASSIKFPTSSEGGSTDTNLIRIAVVTDSLIQAKIDRACAGAFSKHRQQLPKDTMNAEANTVMVSLRRTEGNLWNVKCLSTHLESDGLISQHFKRSETDDRESEVEDWLKNENSRRVAIEIKEFDLEIGV